MRFAWRFLNIFANIIAYIHAIHITVQFQIWVCRASPEMQNAKCKMQNWGTGEGIGLECKKQISFVAKWLFGVQIVASYHKIAFCEAKGFIHFAFCILHFQTPR